MLHTSQHTSHGSRAAAERVRNNGLEASGAMADPPLALTYVAPALNLPPWLSYTSSPTATVLAAYTVATLAPNGAPTLITGAVEITRYETVLLQLAITVDSAADVRGQDLGDLYTTAGGTGTETVVNEYGGTRRFTLGAGETSTGATPTSASATAAPSRTRASPSPTAPIASQEATAPSTCTSCSLLGGLLREDELTLVPRPPSAALASSTAPSASSPTSSSAREASTTTPTTAAAPSTFPPNGTSPCASAESLEGTVPD